MGGGGGDLGARCDLRDNSRHGPLSLPGTENLPRGGQARPVCLVSYGLTTTGARAAARPLAVEGVEGGGVWRQTAENSRKPLFPKTRALARHSVIPDGVEAEEPQVSEGKSLTAIQFQLFPK